MENRAMIFRRYDALPLYLIRITDAEGCERTPYVRNNYNIHYHVAVHECVCRSPIETLSIEFTANY